MVLIMWVGLVGFLGLNSMGRGEVRVEFPCFGERTLEGCLLEVISNMIGCVR